MILSSVLLLFLYVGWKLAESFGTVGTVAIMAVLFVGIAFYRRFHSLKNRQLRAFMVGLVHLEMGFLSFLLTWIIARDLIFIPVGWFDPDISVAVYSSAGTLVVLLLSIATLAIGIGIASAGPWVVRVSVPIRALPPELDGFTIAQLSDMHIGPTTRPETVRRIVSKTLALDPRIVCLTGDIGDGPVSESRAAIAELGALSRIPSFYVTGNHEYYWNGPEWISAVTAVGLRPLLNASARVSAAGAILPTDAVLPAGGPDVMVVGTPDPTARMLGPDSGPDVPRAIGPRPDGSASGRRTEVKVLLAHQPGISGEAKAAGIDLQLSGHTHAGQFFPWTLVVKRVHEFSSGLGRTGDTWVYVNPGTGSWGPQVRLGSKTEITLLTLTKES